MANKIVFRIETNKRKGLYAFCPDTWEGEQTEQLILDNLYVYDKHKTPNADSLLCHVWDYTYKESPYHVTKRDDDYAHRDFWYFGFSSIQQLLSWIDHVETRESIERCSELHLTVYEVEEEFFYQGECQCVFVREKSTCIEHFEIWDYNTYVMLMGKYKK
ncbi:hypothetical protein [Ralstonia phage RSP15]|uniref:hypothetical protein n=1 Tax=Ralstonia phage RSP15 TaxID=1785960 RepID=UPI00074D40D0|nr:hypothetical protein BH754_gp092 [Ralstonia phage RSP15]BAU40050.1 hypothetical protein [Ralstonia phage RSP15]